MRSSTRARWRSSNAAISGSDWLVMKTWKRYPSWSVKESWRRVGPLATAHRPGRFRPAGGGQVEWELAHPGAVADTLVRLDRWCPRRFGLGEDRRSDRP